MNWILEFHEASGFMQDHNARIPVVDKHFIVVKADTQAGAWDIGRGIEDHIRDYKIRAVGLIKPRKLQVEPPYESM